MNVLLSGARLQRPQCIGKSKYNFGCCMVCISILHHGGTSTLHMMTQDRLGSSLGGSN